MRQVVVASKQSAFELKILILFIQKGRFTRLRSIPPIAHRLLFFCYNFAELFVLAFCCRHKPDLSCCVPPIDIKLHRVWNPFKTQNCSGR